jgi:hypothetical protein
VNGIIYPVIVILPEFTGQVLIKSDTYPSRNIWLLLVPAAGSVIFILMYVVATLYYPGGSQADKAAKGFSWAHNYWCNLLNEKGINGEPSSSPMVALPALGVLCVTMAFFAYLFPMQVGFSRRVRVLLQVAGIASMVVALFLFTEFHDWVINVASTLGLVGVVGTMVGLRMLKWRCLFWMGILNLLLVILNNVLYYNEPLMFALPLVQKITFLSFLLWISLISVGLYRGKIPKNGV